VVGDGKQGIGGRRVGEGEMALGGVGVGGNSTATTHKGIWAHRRRTWPTSTAMLGPSARGRAAVMCEGPATGCRLSGA
jgi:hypothetical protein